VLKEWDRQKKFCPHDTKKLVTDSILQQLSCHSLHHTSESQEIIPFACSDDAKDSGQVTVTNLGDVPDDDAEEQGEAKMEKKENHNAESESKENAEKADKSSKKDKKEGYMLLKILVYQGLCDNLLYTKHEIGRGVVIKGVYNKLDTKKAILIGFFEQKPGIYILKVRVGVNISANHYIVVNSWTGQIIDPSYSFPISFQWAYTNGKLDKEKWETILNDLEYHYFETMYQMLSKESRFLPECITNDFTGEANNKDGRNKSRDSRQQTDSTPEVYKRIKICQFFKKGTCKNGDVCKFGHSTMEVAIMEVHIGLGATAVKKFFCDGITLDILERIIGVQIR